MHELALMENVIEMVRSNALESNITRVDKLKLVVGKLLWCAPRMIILSEARIIVKPL